MRKWKKTICAMLSIIMVSGTTVDASNVALLKTQKEAAIDSSYIKAYGKIDNISNETILGADFSNYQQNLEWNKVYYDYKHNKTNTLFDFIKSQGVNTISVKVAVDPQGAATYLSLENAIKTLKEAKAAKLNTNIILMYSDSMTYETAQTLPQGWTAANAADEALEYTKTVLSKFETEDVLPTMITVGNEVNYNFLDLSGASGWEAMGKITTVIKEKGIKVAVGVAAPTSATDIQWVLKELDEPTAAVNYDYVGVSIYPNENTISYMDTLRITFASLKSDKQLFVSSVKYPRISATDTSVNVETQTANIYQLLAATINDKNAGGLICEEAVFAGSWNSFFDGDGVPQTSLAIFAYAQGNQVDVDPYRDPYQYGEDTGLKNQQVNISKLANMSESSIRGMDIGSYIALKDAGVKYYNYKGEEESLLKILHDNGINYIRIRIWNDPYSKDGKPYGGGNCDVETGLRIANEAKKYGMKILLCFHYSDFWADPAGQIIPKAWDKDKKNAEKMAQNVYNFTKDTMQEFKDAGAEIGMVQVGNEITNGMMMETISNAYSNSWGDEEKSRVLSSYLNAGCKAVREVSPKSLIALHLEGLSVDRYRKTMDVWDKYNVDYDILGTSFYTYWAGAVKADGLKKLENIQKLAKSRGKLFAVLETSWLNSTEDADGTPNSVGIGKNIGGYEIGPKGQVENLTDIYNVVLSEENGLGAFYWEPAWVPVKAGWINWQYNKEIADKLGTGWASVGAVDYYPYKKMYYNGQPAWGGSSWDNQALFDPNGNALQSLRFYKDSISKPEEQTSVIHFVDTNGKEITPSTFAKVSLGSSKEVSLPKVTGYVVQNAASSVKVTGTVDGVKEYYVTYAKVQEIKSKKTSYTMTYGTSLELAKEITLSTKTTLKYASSNSKVVSVDAKTGKMTAKGTGNAVITVTASKTGNTAEATKKINVTVSPKVTVKNKGVQNLTQGKTYTMSNYITVGGNATKKFTSSNKAIAKVSSNGTITAVKPGKVTITVNITGSGSKDSITKKITTYVVPKKQTISNVTASSKALTVTLKKDTTASGYEIMAATNSKFTTGKKTVTVKNTKTVKTKISKLSAKKQYYVRVRSYKTIDGKKHYGAWSTVKKIKTK